MAGRIPLIHEGTGTTLWYRYPGNPNFRRFPLLVKKADITGKSKTQYETTHLASRLAGRGQYGGKTFRSGRLADPGIFSVEAFYDPNIYLPEGLIAFLVRFLTPPEWASGAKILFRAEKTDESESFPLNDAMTMTMSMKITGFIETVQAIRRYPVAPPVP